MFRDAQQARLPMFGDALNRQKTCSTRYEGGGQQTAPARKPLRGDSAHATRECVFPRPENAFGSAASIVLPCSQPAPLIFSVETIENSRKPIGFLVFTIENN